MDPCLTVGLPKSITSTTGMDALTHALGGFYGVPHGLANAVLLPVVIESYGKKAHKKLAQLADAVNISGSNDEEKANKFIKAIRDMNEYMNIPKKINLDTSKWYIKEEDLPLMIKHALSEANPQYPCPCIFGYNDLYNLYYKIM